MRPLKTTPRLHRLESPAARREALTAAGCLSAEDWEAVASMTPEAWTAELDGRLENVLASYPMPIGIAVGFTVNGVERVVPMVTEERTIIAGASKAAKLAGGAFSVRVGRPITRGHAIFTGIGLSADEAFALAEKPLDVLVAAIKERQRNEARRSGRLVDAWAEALAHPERGTMLKVSVCADVGETMGANAVTRLGEEIARGLGEAIGLKPVAAICCNDVPERTVWATAAWKPGPDLSPAQIERVLDMQAWAEIDPSRAVTHNKGVMNGVSAVCAATGQDVRAIEAGAAADAYRTGACKPLTTYTLTEDGALSGRLDLQLGLASIGGATGHPMAAFCRKLMRAERAGEIAAVAAAVGLAQNFAALLSLTNEGIAAAHAKLGKK